MRQPTTPTTHELSRYKDLGELHTLLLQACPPDERGKSSVPVLAGHLGITPQYIYRWLDEEQIPPRFVTRIVKLSKGRVTLEQFLPFVFG